MTDSCGPLVWRKVLVALFPPAVVIALTGPFRKTMGLPMNPRLASVKLTTPLMSFRSQRQM